jgi:hypothetical protein
MREVRKAPDIYLIGTYQTALTSSPPHRSPRSNSVTFEEPHYFSPASGVTFRSPKWAIVPCPTQSAIPPLDKGYLRSLTISVGWLAPLT